jgi:hypothetical protein
MGLGRSGFYEYPANPAGRPDENGYTMINQDACGYKTDPNACKTRSATQQRCCTGRRTPVYTGSLQTAVSTGVFPMSIAKNIEISSTSTVSFEDAIKKGIAEAAKTVKNLKGCWVKEQKADLDGDRITNYQVMMILTFVVDHVDQ